MRHREGDSDNTYSFGFNVRHPSIPRLGISAALDLVGFSNQQTEGLIATLRTAKYFHAGHRVGLVLGDRISSDRLFEREDRSTQWARLEVEIELPHGLFAETEYELTTGDDIEGQRLSLGAGYRF